MFKNNKMQKIFCLKRLKWTQTRETWYIRSKWSSVDWKAGKQQQHERMLN